MRSTGLYILDLMSLDSLLFDLMYYDQGLNKMQVRKYGSMVEWVLGYVGKRVEVLVLRVNDMQHCFNSSLA